MINIPFDKKWNNIAISVSGGADSALLAYMVCQKAKDHNVTIHIINNIRCWKTKPWQQYDADHVLQWLFQKFYSITFKRHTNFIAPELEYAVSGPVLVDEYNKTVSGDNIQQRAYAEYICKAHEIDAYYNGVTRNPAGTNFGGMKERDIDEDQSNGHLLDMLHMGVRVLHPFRFTDKSKIVKMYKDLDIMDLFEITRSCEGKIAGIDYTTYTSRQSVPACGKCFWCKEREWAIEQNK